MNAQVPKAYESHNVTLLTLCSAASLRIGSIFSWEPMSAHWFSGLTRMVFLWPCTDLEEEVIFEAVVWSYIYY